MRHSMIVLLIGGIASMITIPLVAAIFTQNKRTDSNDLPQRDEVRQTFNLAPGTRVEVSSIRGPVEIETANIEVAEIHIVRSAKSRDDLEQYKITVENKPQSLIIRGEQRERDSRSSSGFGPDVRHHVMLKLPRRVDLYVSSISGPVTIGNVDGKFVANSISGSLSVGVVDGQIQVSSVSGGVDIAHAMRQVEVKSVSGNVKIGQASDFLDVSGVSGELSAGVLKLGERGVQIKSISGPVELRFKDDLNAQLSTASISGQVIIDVPNVMRQNSPDSSRIRAIIGKGGPPISITGVSKNVRLTHGT